MKPTITPRQLSIYTQPITDIYIALEQEIFDMIVNRLKTNKGNGKDYVLQWQVEKMQQLRMLNIETIQALSKATGIAEKEIIHAINEVGYETIHSVDEELKHLKKKRPIPTHIDTILEQYVKQTFREIDNYVNQTLITTQYGEGTVTRMYRKIVEETTGRVLAGTKTINQAMAETVIRWANKGVETSFVDKGGNAWHVERYVDTVLRSTVNRTYNELRMSRMDDHDVSLVLVSSHAEPRPACSKIQGRVASIKPPSENTSKYPSVYEFGYGEPDGIRGINCKHIFYPYIEGLSENNQIQYDEEKANERYELTQKQRYYERQIRKAKRSLKIAEQAGEEQLINKYKKQVRNRQAKVREFINTNDLPRRYDKERIIL